MGFEPLVHAAVIIQQCRYDLKFLLAYGFIPPFVGWNESGLLWSSFHNGIYPAITIASSLLGRAVVFNHGTEDRVADGHLLLLHSKVSMIFGDIPSQVPNF